MAWQDIETVPARAADDEPLMVLLWGPHLGIHIGHAFLRPNGTKHPRASGFLHVTWTKWHPLPDEPEVP